jgi:hypothetical protein
MHRLFICAISFRTLSVSFSVFQSSPLGDTINYIAALSPLAFGAHSRP